jgi:nucleotide-binding universal stress UspA family protein
MKNDNKVLACVDQSGFADFVADYAVWAARRMDAPLEFLHALDHHPELGSGIDHSGAIGIDAQENLMNRLSAEDATRTKSAREQGRIFLNRLKERAIAAGAGQVDMRQRHGELIATLQEQEEDVRLVVLGQRGESTVAPAQKLGSHVERTVRTLHKPILTVTQAFKEPERVMIAFDGGTVARRGVQMVAVSPLFQGLQIHLLMCSPENDDDAAKQLDWARACLANAGFEVSTALTSGDAKDSINKEIIERSIDLLIMGAYSRSPIRSLLFGSKTTALLRVATIPTLLLRQLAKE